MGEANTVHEISRDGGGGEGGEVIRSRTCWAVPSPSSEASPSFTEMFIIDRGVL